MINEYETMRCCSYMTKEFVQDVLSCVKAGSQCSNCYPGSLDLCKNQEKTTSEEVVPLSPSIHTQGHHHFDPEICSYTHPISSVVSEVSVVSNDLSSQSKSALCHSSELLSCSNASLHDSFSVSPLPEFEPLAEPSFTWGVWMVMSSLMLLNLVMMRLFTGGGTYSRFRQGK